MKLTIAGIGIRGTRQITLETLDAIRNATKILFLPVVSKDFEEFLKSHTNQAIENLLPLYKDAAKDNENYERIYQHVLSDCQTFGNVLLLVPGDPRIGVSVVQWFDARKEALGLELNVLPGISSFATMTNDLGKDPLERGSVIIDANRLLLFNYSMENSLDYYIYHVCSIGTERVHLSDPAHENKIDVLKNHLLKFYPADYEAELISSAVKADDGGTKQKCAIGKLETLLGKVHFGTTLHIPAMAPSKIDRTYLKLLVGASC